MQERHRLVVSQPALRPWITQACEVLGCRIEPLRRIDAVVIDSSELVSRLGNFYSFDLVVKNTAAIDVAVPALELSLTDSSDTVIARRVFLPQEWPNAPRLLPANGNLAVSFRLSLTLGAALWFVVASGVGVVLGLERLDSSAALVDAGALTQLFSLHRFALVFGVAAPLMLGLSLWTLPAQLHASNISVPRLAAFGWWAWLAGSATVLVSNPKRSPSSGGGHWKRSP